MKKISAWAKHNVVPARIVIFCIHISLIFLAGYLGTHLHKLHATVFYTAGILIIFIFIVYPRPAKKIFYGKKFYAVQKTCDFIAAAGIFMLLCFFANHNLRLPSLQNSLYAVSLHPKNEKPTAQQILESLKYRDKSTLTRQEKRILKKEFKNQLGVYAKATLKHDKAGQSHAVEIIFTIIVAIGLFGLLSALACTISCNGADGLAVLVMVVGTAGIVWGAVAIINSLSKKHKSKKQAGNAGGETSNHNLENFSFIPVLP
jgi:hypothetical protein